MNESHFDVAVIGGGIVGCMNAFWLARRGMTVAILERDRIGCGTTNNSFAWINATSKSDEEAYHRLNALGGATYRELAAEFGEEAMGLNPCGMVKIARRCDEAGWNETREQADFLVENRCDSVQGYFYSYPLPQDEFLEFVERQDFHTQRRKALEIVQ